MYTIIVINIYIYSVLYVGASGDYNIILFYWLNFPSCSGGKNVISRKTVSLTREKLCQISREFSFAVYRARICKCLREPRNRFLGSLNVYKFGLRFCRQQIVNPLQAEEAIASSVRLFLISKNNCRVGGV